MCIAAGTSMCTLAIRDHFYYRLGLGRGYTQTARGDRRECALQGRNHGTKQLKFNIFHIEGGTTGDTDRPQDRSMFQSMAHCRVKRLVKFCVFLGRQCSRYDHNFCLPDKFCKKKRRGAWNTTSPWNAEMRLYCGVISFALDVLNGEPLLGSEG